MLLKVNSNMAFFWKNGHFISDDFIHHQQRSLDFSIYPILELFSKWKEENEIFTLLNHTNNFSEEFLKDALFQLKESKILIKRDSEEHKQEKELEFWENWGFSCKYFHYNTRLLHKDQYTDINDQYKRLSVKRKKENPPSIYKNIDGAEKIKLPLPSYKREAGFLETLLGRQTVRSFNEEPITLNNLSTMLYLTYGAQSCKYEIGIDNLLFKTSPSGGCRHPIEVYPVILNVNGLENGLYHYSVENHELEVIHKHDMIDKVVDMVAGQNYVKRASVLFFYTACVERSMWKYQSPRTYRVLMMDMGHLSQTCFLVANWLGLGCFFSGHLNDQYVEEELKINFDQEIVLGVSGIGYRSNESLEMGRDLRFVKELSNEI
ncbi:SagB-type dehydrogenase family enzyme [Bacillus thermophilus]|uniref:SagB-type dehydrogenase family enzyme n=1 Tax=Siminovitchia thermophila TaxID=1245522 RepID=A0ABS2R6L7_9BACI|nr:SagB/ThcOx family dehydrogenase [Siminovitchia thermophila]MBM7715301.1 SagB-type dehydrogenase family enzyme [Siminovitchia thermophila]ONK24649.1 NADH oxidase [Bacillus sp. VT-16-64]